MNKIYKQVGIKAVKDSKHPNGEFEVILSTDALDRDGEIVEPKGLRHAPTIPIHAWHDVTKPVGRATVSLENGILVGKGFYGKTAFAQDIRTLVDDGIIDGASVGMTGVRREVKDGIPHIVEAEVFEASLTTIPANREALVTASKQYDAKVLKALPNTYEARQRLLRDALALQHEGAWMINLIGTRDAEVVYEVEQNFELNTYQAAYSFSAEGALTVDTPVQVELQEVVVPLGSEAGKSIETNPEDAPPAPDKVPDARTLAAVALAEAELVLVTTGE